MRRPAVPGDLHPCRYGRQDHPPPRVSRMRHAHHDLGKNDRRLRPCRDTSFNTTARTHIGVAVLSALRTSACALRSRGPERATVAGLRAHVDVSPRRTLRHELTWAGNGPLHI